MLFLRNVLFFFLMLILGFFTGIQYANIIEAGKGQMLAAGAIVLGYGVVGAGIFLAIAVFVYFKYRKKSGYLKKWNYALTVLIACFFIYFKVKYEVKKASQEEPLGYLNSGIDRNVGVFQLSNDT